jgi:hypothetical protein
MNAPAHPDERQELHNASVDEEVARAGCCAQVHLPTGRTCVLEHGHDGSCHFVAHDELYESLPRAGPANADDEGTDTQHVDGPSTESP